jgi:hypothetical protein
LASSARLGVKSSLCNAASGLRKKYSDRDTGQGGWESENIIKSGPAPKPGWGKSFAPESERKWRDGQEAGKKVMAI